MVSTGSSPRTIDGETPRGRGASGVGGKNDPDDVYEMTAGGVKYYNGAVLEGSTAITGISKDQVRNPPHTRSLSGGYSKPQ